MCRGCREGVGVGMGNWHSYINSFAQEPPFHLKKKKMKRVAQPERCMLPKRSLPCFIAPATSSSGNGMIIQATFLNVYQVSVFFRTLRGKPESLVSWDTAFCSRPLLKWKRGIHTEQDLKFMSTVWWVKNMGVKYTSYKFSSKPSPPVMPPIEVKPHDFCVKYLLFTFYSVPSLL